MLWIRKNVIAQLKKTHSESCDFLFFFFRFPKNKFQHLWFYEFNGNIISLKILSLKSRSYSKIVMQKYLATDSYWLTLLPTFYTIFFFVISYLSCKVLYFRFNKTTFFLNFIFSYFYNQYNDAYLMFLFNFNYYFNTTFNAFRLI